jgi:hypothetical protein
LGFAFGLGTFLANSIALSRAVISLGAIVLVFGAGFTVYLTISA